MDEITKAGFFDFGRSRFIYTTDNYIKPEPRCALQVVGALTHIRGRNSTRAGTAHEPKPGFASALRTAHLTFASL